MLDEDLDAIRDCVMVALGLDADRRGGHSIQCFLRNQARKTAPKGVAVPAGDDKLSGVTESGALQP